MKESDAPSLEVAAIGFTAWSDEVVDAVNVVARARFSEGTGERATDKATNTREKNPHWKEDG